MTMATMRHKDFAAFILTHGRPNNVITYRSLRKAGYTGAIYIIVDNEDDTLSRYRTNFGDQVIVFDKPAIAQTFDEADNFGDRRAVIYARNASFQIARDLGLTYFLQLDDDYDHFEYRTYHQPGNDQEHFMLGQGLDAIFDDYLDFYQSIDAKSIAMSQGGDFFGGADELFDKPWRKAMNTFFCSVERPFQFVGRINEDVNTYVWYQSLGNLFLTAPFVMVHQQQSQSSEGGMTELYLDSGTYVKSFYTVMFAPSCTTINLMGRFHMRLHHQIAWHNAVPKIVPESCRKGV
jgi:hypothetical protein